jgi:phage shock protein PspC (stress-responsive transcriptional regulator)
MTNLETEPAPLPPPTPQSPPYENRWARSDDRVVLGVAGGLGRALALEPLFVRIAFVVLALFSGVGILLYIAALALLADSPTSRPPSVARRVVGAIAVLLAVRWLFSGGASLPDPGWVVAIGLLGAAVALWRGRTPAALPPAVPASDAMATSTGESTGERWNSWSTQRRDRPRPPRSALGLLTVGLATVVGALVWLLADNSGNRGAYAFGWATVVIGAGLLVGTFVGRARWLIVPALATATAAVVASAFGFTGVGLDARSGDRTEFVGPGSSVAPEYRTSFGSFELVLVDYPGDVATAIDVGVGDLTVVVPDNARVQVDARVGIGAIDVLGSSRSGYRRTLTLDSKNDGGLIKLTLRTGVGHIEVRRGTLFDQVPPITAPKLFPDIPIIRSFGDGTVLFSDGSIDFGDGRRIEADGSYRIAIVEQRPDGSVQLDNGAIVRADGTVVTPGGFVISRPGHLPTVPSTVAAAPTTGVQP